MPRAYDLRWQAVNHLLTYPPLYDGLDLGQYIHPASGTIDWHWMVGYLERNIAERLLLQAAYGLWNGYGGDLAQCADRLIAPEWDRLTDTLQLYRGERPDLAVYPARGGF